MRKVIEKNGGVKEERLYLGSGEVYRESQSETVQLERETLHISDDNGRIAIVDTKTIDGGTQIGAPENEIRYQFSNHLGSSILELDNSAAIISYEEYHLFGTSSYRSGGNNAETALKRYRYVGKERDEETGLYYHGARYYAGWLARFVSVDPLKDDYPYYTPYQYEGNQPIVAIDLDGLEPAHKVEDKKEFSNEVFDIQQVSDDLVIETNTITGEQRKVKTGTFRLDEVTVVESKTGGKRLKPFLKKPEKPFWMVCNLYWI